MKEEFIIQLKRLTEINKRTGSRGWRASILSAQAAKVKEVFAKTAQEALISLSELL